MQYGVVIADDQGVARKYFEFVIGADPELRVLYSLPSLGSVQSCCAARRVDLALLGATFADGSSGIDIIPVVKSVSPSTKVLIVGCSSGSYLIDRARELGADGFWCKDSAEPELAGVLSDVLSGLGAWPKDPPDVPIGDALMSELTASETDVLCEIATGASNRMIAEALGIEIGTVKSHINHLLRKTGFSNRTSLAIEARLRGIAAGSVVRCPRYEREP